VKDEIFWEVNRALVVFQPADSEALMRATARAAAALHSKALFGLLFLKFNSHHINVPSNT
jgi:hypothetical protein